jgi:hypothetical protein
LDWEDDVNILLATAVASTFNLVCTGTSTIRTFGGENAEGYSKEYRIDLGVKKWCENDCQALHDFAAIGPVQLTLAAKPEDLRSGDFTSHQINRQTGEESLTVTSGRGAAIVILKAAGTCQAAPFSGFPKFEAKF